MEEVVTPCAFRSINPVIAKVNKINLTVKFFIE
jgi:hypothetical protein